MQRTVFAANPTSWLTPTNNCYVLAMDLTVSGTIYDKIEVLLDFVQLIWCVSWYTMDKKRVSLIL